MEAACSPETSFDYQRNTGIISEKAENLKSCLAQYILSLQKNNLPTNNNYNTIHIYHHTINNVRKI